MNRKGRQVSVNIVSEEKPRRIFGILAGNNKRIVAVEETFFLRIPAIPVIAEEITLPKQIPPPEEDHSAS